MKIIIAALLLSIGIALGGFFVSKPLIMLKNHDQVISVKGLAERIVKSDKAIWQIQFTYSSDSLTDLYQGIAAAQQKVKNFLQTENFSVDDIELQPVSIVDNQSNTYSSNTKASRFIATGSVVLNTKKVDEVRKALQDTGNMVAQGVVISQSIVQYVFTQLNMIKPGMLDEATNNAKVAAQSFARTTNSHLGVIRDASQGLFTISDVTEGVTSVMKQVRVVTSVSYYLIT